MVESAETAAQFIRENLPLVSPHGLPELQLRLAAPSSRVTALLDDDGGTPYWAYAWPGGLALARHVITCPETVRAQRVVDFGSGSGVVAIAALKSGAASVVAVDTDPLAAVTIGINAEANGFALQTETAAVSPETHPADVIFAADTFYAADVAKQTMKVLKAYARAGARVLVGDIGRRYLPREVLTEIARYPVPEFGAPGQMQDGFVFTLAKATA